MISVITPTEERPHFLQRVYRMLCQQTHVDWEWLIYDTSLRPWEGACDRRIRYIHSAAPLSIGEKRNTLIRQGKGKWIVHFDDDDYYSPLYLEKIAEKLLSHQFFHIHAWYAYHLAGGGLFYWDNQKSSERYVVDPFFEKSVREISCDRQDYGQMIERGYGFTFAYHKELAESTPFLDVDFREDEMFYDEVGKKGAKVHSYADREGICVKIMHDRNVSRIYPQYRLPPFLNATILPHFSDYVKRYSYEN
ncbi:MAG: glycosyltransferase family 2 protein [Chlamydiales bacterium]